MSKGKRQRQAARLAAANAPGSDGSEMGSLPRFASQRTEPPREGALSPQHEPSLCREHAPGEDWPDGVPLVHRNGELSSMEDSSHGPHPDGVPPDDLGSEGRDTSIARFQGSDMGAREGGNVGASSRPSMQRFKKGVSFKVALATAGDVHLKLAEDPHLGYVVASRIDMIAGPVMFVAYLVATIVILWTK